MIIRWPILRTTTLIFSVFINSRIQERLQIIWLFSKPSSPCAWNSIWISWTTVDLNIFYCNYCINNMSMLNIKNFVRSPEKKVRKFSEALLVKQKGKICLNTVYATFRNQFFLMLCRHIFLQYYTVALSLEVKDAEFKAAIFILPISHHIF